MTAIGAALLMLGQMAAPAEDMLHLRSMRSDDGSALSVSITREQAEAVPVWNPEEKEVSPLSIELAIGLARDSIEVRHPTVAEFQVRSIEMSRLHRAYPDRWFYTIKFWPLVEGRPLIGGLYVSFVLMDGTVVAPKTDAP